jgi:predicted HNH restriction endonuclease
MDENICPTCDEEFKNNYGMKIHHAKVHGESLSGVIRTCGNCSTEFRKSKWNDKNKDKNYCSRECYYESMRTGLEYEQSYGPTWQSQRELAIRRDFARCRCCNISQEDCKEKYGQGLQVHHKTPYENFEEDEKAHRLRNLITFCPSCHQTIEKNNL